MKALTYFVAVAALTAAVILAQDTAPRSNTQNRGASSSQMQKSRANTEKPAQSTPNAKRSAPRAPQFNVNPPAPHGQQRSTKAGPAMPAYMNQTPAQRAAATHTPDPGTCMNPAALQTGEGGTPPAQAPPCK